MYIRVGNERRGVGLGWTGGFTIPGDTTRYSTEKCTGSAALPMTNGDIICAMPDEQGYLNGIGCTAIGFRGSHACRTDAGNEGAFFCCPPGVLQQQLASGGSAAPFGIPVTQLLGLVGIVAVMGVIGFFLWKRGSEPEEELGDWDIE